MRHCTLCWISWISHTAPISGTRATRVSTTTSGRVFSTSNAQIKRQRQEYFAPAAVSIYVTLQVTLRLYLSHNMVQKPRSYATILCPCSSSGSPCTFPARISFAPSWSFWIVSAGIGRSAWDGQISSKCGIYISKCSRLRIY